MASGKKNKVEYMVNILEDSIELARSDEYETRRLQIKKNVEEKYEINLYVDGKLEISIETWYLPSEIRWITNKEKIYEYSRAFGEPVIIQKITKELIKYISEYLKF